MMTMRRWISWMRTGVVSVKMGWLLCGAMCFGFRYTRLPRRPLLVLIVRDYYYYVCIYDLMRMRMMMKGGMIGVERQRGLRRLQFGCL